MTALSDFCVKGGAGMAHRTRIWFKAENRIRQKEFLDKGIVMLPKKPIREKNRHKQLATAKMML